MKRIIPTPRSTQDKRNLKKIRDWKCKQLMRTFLDHTLRGVEHHINIRDDYTAHVTYEGNYELSVKQKLELTKYNFHISQIHKKLLSQFSHADVEAAILDD